MEPGVAAFSYHTSASGENWVCQKSSSGMRDERTIEIINTFGVMISQFLYITVTSLCSNGLSSFLLKIGESRRELTTFLSTTGDACTDEKARRPTKNEPFIMD